LGDRGVWWKEGRRWRRIETTDVGLHTDKVDRLDAMQLFLISISPTRLLTHVYVLELIRHVIHLLLRVCGLLTVSWLLRGQRLLDISASHTGSEVLRGAGVLLLLLLGLVGIAWRHGLSRGRLRIIAASTIHLLYLGCGVLPSTSSRRSGSRSRSGGRGGGRMSGRIGRLSGQVPL